MKRIIIAIIVLLIISSVAYADTIGENFEKGGVVVGGSGYVYLSLEDYWAVRVSPYVDFLLADGLVLGLGLSAYRNYYEEFEFEWFPFIGYVFGYNAKASTGPAHRIHISVGGSFYDDGFGSSSIGGSLTPYYTLYYFVAPRIAPYVQLSAISLYFGDGGGTSTYLNAAFGISFHVANKDRVIGAAQ